MAVALFAGRRVGELVCALATERPSPVRTINANGLSSRVEELLPIRFRFIALVPVLAFVRPDDRRGPAQWPIPRRSSLSLAFGNNWRRRGFALAVVRPSLRIARSDAEESQRRCSQ